MECLARTLPVLALCLVGLGGGGGGAPATQPAAIVRREFIYETAPFPACHASTIVQASDGRLVAAWFGGTAERNPDVGIWLSRDEGGGWSVPVEVVNGKGAGDGGRRLPCWNPVLFQPRRGPLMLFYKVGPSPDTWWGMLTTSADGGRTWGAPRRLPDGILGPIKDKPIQLPDGTILCGSSTEHDGWRVHMERSPDLGKTWTRTGPLNDGRTVGAIQPAVLWHDAAKQRLQILCRSRTGGRILTAWSEDGGQTWGELAPVAALPNPNSGIDAVTLADGRHLLVYNHTPRGRSPLNVAVSDDGKDWKAGPVLESEPGEFSYPAVIQADDGSVHVTYTWQRKRIRHVVIDPRRLTLREMTGGTGPTK